MMNAIQSFLAVAIVAFSVNASAQIVYIPDFPVKKSVETASTEQKASTTEAIDHSVTVIEKAA